MFGTPSGDTLVFGFGLLIVALDGLMFFVERPTGSTFALCLLVKHRTNQIYVCRLLLFVLSRAYYEAGGHLPDDYSSCSNTIIGCLF
jgi:hypothetical protein